MGERPAVGLERPLEADVAGTRRDDRLAEKGLGAVAGVAGGGLVDLVEGEGEGEVAAGALVGAGAGAVDDRDVLGDGDGAGSREVAGPSVSGPGPLSRGRSGGSPNRARSRW